MKCLRIGPNEEKCTRDAAPGKDYCLLCDAYFESGCMEKMDPFSPNFVGKVDHTNPEDERRSQGIL